MDMSDKNDLYSIQYKSSKRVDLEFYFDAYRGLIRSSDFYQYFEMSEADIMDTICNNANVNEKLWKDLAKYCSIDNLTVDGELPKMIKSTYQWCKDPVDPSIIDNVQLQTVNCVRMRNEKQRKIILSNSKYTSEKPVFYEESENKAEILEPENDILIYVKVYKPFKCRYYEKDNYVWKSNKAAVHSVIAMHGSQTLDKLRDKIFCFADNSVSKDISEMPLRLKVPNAKDVYKSGFFFIEGTFYNDFRDPTNKDNSKVIRDWSEKHRYGIYHTAKMEETKIGSLTLKFGFPYVYQHQGDCEHLITFSNARLVNQTDELDSNCYPRIVRITSQRFQYCMTCGIYNVVWVVKNSNRLPHNPSLFCEFCFKTYNYMDNKKIGEFEAYPYPYDSELDSQLND